MRLNIIPVVWAICALSSPSARAAEEALDGIPATAGIVIRYRRPELSLNKKVLSLAKKVDQKLAKDVQRAKKTLGTLIANPELTGIDPRSDWWTIVFFSAGGPPKVAYAVREDNSDEMQAAIGDHGVSFISGASRRRVTNANPQDILPTLLMIKAPGQQSPTISDRNVESIDIVPTVADILGITIPWPLEGQSAVDESIPARLRKDVLHGNRRLGFDGSFNQRFKSVERKLEHFGSGTDPHGLFKIGPFSQCVGRNVEEFEVSDNAPMTVHIENNDSYFPNLSRPRHLVPCLLRGKIEAAEDVKSPVSLAFSVNGVVGAVTRTYVLEGLEDVWSVMLPQDALG